MNERLDVDQLIARMESPRERSTTVLAVDGKSADSAPFGCVYETFVVDEGQDVVGRQIERVTEEHVLDRESVRGQFDDQAGSNQEQKAQHRSQNDRRNYISAGVED